MNKQFYLLYPVTNDGKKFLNNMYGEYYETADTGPYNEGYIVDKFEIPEYLENDIDIYEIDNRYTDRDDIITSFWDGDMTDDEFKYIG